MKMGVTHLVDVTDLCCPTSHVLSCDNPSALYNSIVIIYLIGFSTITTWCFPGSWTPIWVCDTFRHSYLFVQFCNYCRAMLPWFVRNVALLLSVLWHPLANCLTIKELCSQIGGGRQIVSVLIWVIAHSNLQPFL